MRQENGFTLIEVMLFLAISAAFLLIAFIGLGGTTAQVQFSDSMRSLQSFLQRQQNDVFNGVNVRDDGSNCFYAGAAVQITNTPTPVGQSECIIMGRLVEFEDEVVNVYAIVGRRLTRSAPPNSADYLDPDAGDFNLILDADPYVIVGNYQTTYAVKWLSEFRQGLNNGTVATNAFGYLRSPGGANIYNFVLPGSININSNFPLNVGTLAFDDQVSATYCFAGEGTQRAEIQIGGSERSDSIEVEFDTGCAP